MVRYLKIHITVWFYNQVVTFCQIPTIETPHLASYARYGVLFVCWNLKSPVTQLFFQWLFGADNKENIKAVHHLPFLRGICWWRVDSPHKGPMMQEALPCRDIIMQLIFIKDLERKLLGEICSWLDQHWFHYGWVMACLVGAGIKENLTRGGERGPGVLGVGRVRVGWDGWHGVEMGPGSVKTNGRNGWPFNSSPHGQNGCHFTDNIFECIFLMEIFEFQIKLHWNMFLGV